MKEDTTFSSISRKYEELSLLQKSAGEILLAMLEIRNDDVLDLGCGTGSLTRKIRKLTRGKVVGVDLSAGMIEEARRRSGADIIFEVKSAEELDYENCFDVIFCNSAFQWFREPEKAIENCLKALKPGGRIGIQAPAKEVYCPNFIEAVERVKRDERTKSVFKHFKSPWFFLETAEEYRKLFEKFGFMVVFSKIECVKTKHTPEEVFGIFSSGAIAGYLNQEFYTVELTEDYINAFKEIARQAFREQAVDGVVELKFYRVFLIAAKV